MKLLKTIITLCLAGFACDLTAETIPERIFVGRSGDVWLNANSIRGADGTLRAAPRSPLPKTVPIESDSYGNVWGFAKDGDKTHVAAVLMSQPDEWKIFSQAEGIAPGEWSAIIVDNFGFVWVGGKDGIMRFDPRKPEAGWIRFPDDKLPDAAVTSFWLSFTGCTLAAFADGSLLELDMRADNTIIANSLAPDEVPRHSNAVFMSDTDGAICLAAIAGERVIAEFAMQPPEGAWQHNWRELARMPVGSHDFYGVLLDGRMYAAAGLAIYGYPPEMQPLPELWAYDPANNRWRIVSAVPTNRWYCGIATLDDEIWLLGGFHTENKKRLSTDVVEIYNPKTNRWRQGPKLDAPRAELVALTVGERIYVVGGVNDKPDGTANILSIVSIGRGETEWRGEAPTPNVVRQASGCVLDGKIYIAGGQAMNSPGLQVYDVKRSEWEAGIPPYPGKPASTPLCAVHNGEIWLMGGSGIDDPLRVARYLPETKEWKSGPELPEPTGWAAAYEIDGKLYIAGGACHSPEHKHWIFSDRTFVLRD